MKLRQQQIDLINYIFSRVWFYYEVVDKVSLDYDWQKQILRSYISTSTPVDNEEEGYLVTEASKRWIEVALQDMDMGIDIDHKSRVVVNLKEPKNLGWAYRRDRVPADYKEPSVRMLTQKELWQLRENTKAAIKRFDELWEAKHGQNPSSKVIATDDD